MALLARAQRATTRLRHQRQPPAPTAGTAVAPAAMYVELHLGGIWLRFLLAVPAAYARDHVPSDACFFDLGACRRLSGAFALGRTPMGCPSSCRKPCVGLRRPKRILHSGTNNPSASVAVVPLQGEGQSHIRPSFGNKAILPGGFCRRSEGLATVGGTALLCRPPSPDGLRTAKGASYHWHICGAMRGCRPFLEGALCEACQGVAHRRTRILGLPDARGPCRGSLRL